MKQDETKIHSKLATKALLIDFIDLTVPFYDVDPMRIVWHGNYVKYLEKARCHLLEKIDYDYEKMESSGFAWPVVDIRLKYVASAKFNSKIRIFTYLMEYESRLKIDYEIYDLATNKVLNKAYSIQVAVDLKTEEMLYESPPILFQKLKGLLK